MYTPAPISFVIEKQLRRTMKMLEKNNMQAFYAENAEQALELVKTLLPKNATVSCGGSVTLEQTGVMNLLRNGDYNFLDRQGLTPEQIDEMYRKVFSADCYLTSCNAVTEQGELYNVDGNANRVAAMCFGPKSVICVVGCNKIVPNLEQAKERLQSIAAPANAHRLERKTPCAATGHCADCRSPERICCTTVVHQFQRIPNRIKVILVAEPLGY